jgi:ribosome-associated protein
MARRKPRPDAPAGSSADAPRPPSKSQLKRDSEALQALGVALADAPRELVEGLDLPERLLKAIDELRGITKHGALRRQRQFVGKLMRDVDPAPIRAALEASGQEDAAAKRRFRTAETWRDRILREGATAIEACAAALGADAAELTALHARASGPGSPIQRKTAARELFRYLHRAAGADKLPR